MSRCLQLLWTVMAIALGNCVDRAEANITAATIQFINNITLTGRAISTAGNTSEDKALLWLVTENDPLYQFTPGTVETNTRLAQRYALATYFIQNSKATNYWLYNQSECLWLDVGCSNSSNVTSLGNRPWPPAVGTVSIDLGLLTSLQSVYLVVFGALPTTIGKWTNLNSIHFDCSSTCSSTLPTEIGDWRNVREVYFRYPEFKGSIPASIGKWTNAQLIWIQLTGFNGTLPTSIGNWTSAETVKIYDNQFLSGTLPATIGLWSSLRQFEVHNNQFTGMLPESIRSWTGVERMFLYSNRFSGSLPIGNWVNLTDLRNSNNYFTSTISPAVANWTRIAYFFLEDNNFTGTIPRSICRYRSNFVFGPVADCPNEVACWCCSGCAAPNITEGEISGILFRELNPGAQDGSWGPGSIDIPGFDHVALSYLDTVYESHPGYRNGRYISADRVESRIIPVVDGVQNEHTLETFRHNSPSTGTSVLNFQVIPIDNSAALAMRNVITPRVQVAGFLAFTSVEEFVSTHAPSAQKGGNGKFTCVGLIEWAAEQAGINTGQGFVPNAIESITTPNETFPLLSPELLYFALQNQGLVFSTPNYLLGYFDPVDHLLTDPVGRRTGIVNRTEYKEIPNAATSPRGEIETIVVVNPIPGEYVLKVYGIPGKKGIASVQVSGRPSVTVRTNGTASVQEESVVVPVASSGSRGDVNGDGVINQTDLNLLKGRIPVTVGGFANTADMNGDGQLNQTDVDLLAAYLNIPIVKAPSTSPNRSPVVVAVPTPRAVDAPVPVQSPIIAPVVVAVPTPRAVDVPFPIQSPMVPIQAPAVSAPSTAACPATDKCNSGFMLHRRTLLCRCIQRCTSNRWIIKWRLRGTAWKCGKCQT